MSLLYSNLIKVGVEGLILIIYDVDSKRSVQFLPKLCLSNMSKSNQKKFRFARHPTFMFLLYDVLSRHEAYLGHFLVLNRQSTRILRLQWSTVSVERITVIQLERAANESKPHENAMDATVIHGVLDPYVVPAPYAAQELGNLCAQANILVEWIFTEQS